ncbi:SdrD B-like domain-containing protein, partial [Spirosoma sp. 48-14]|uniref:SdrD B-like domain-containing protein n=1 Tax=Spirosoma sp. 48-14 TaxID=1895854 RepID=UPI00095C2A26
MSTFTKKQFYWHLFLLSTRFRRKADKFLPDIGSVWQTRLRTLLVTCLVASLATGVVKAQCSVTINKVTTSGCYSLSGVSKATVSVEVAWNNAPANQYIVVTTGALSRTITPGVISVQYGDGGTTTPTGSQTIVSPQVVAFEVNANGASAAITAKFNSTTTCSNTSSYTAPSGCLPTVCASGSLGGQVFNDYNANGIKDDGEKNGVGGVTVKIYPCDNSAPVSVTTDAYGIWSTSASLAYPVRVEFTNIPAAYLASSTLQGTDSRTTVQFITASNCNVNLGVNDPIDYCQNEPLIVLPTYVSGNPLGGGNSGTYRGLIGFPYASAGNGTNDAMTFTVPLSSVGTLWAQAYSKITKRLFSAATLKRHAGLGPGGLGAIYITNLTDQANPSTPEYINLSASPFNIDVGSVLANGTGGRNLPSDKSLQSSDPQAFSLIGTVGIGGMSISGDGETLYLMNIKNSSLYALDLSTYNTTKNKNDITLKGGPYAVPSLGCVDGIQRSWAVKFSKGKVYVGTICDASSSSKSNLRAGIFTFDPTTNSFNSTPIFDFPLTYPKGYPEIATPDITGWYPWSNTFSDFVTTGTFGSVNQGNLSTNLVRPQPILTDIEFDIDGSMILALSDRAGLQTGFRNYNTTGSGDYSGRVGGDLLRAFSSQGTFVLENAAKAGPDLGGRPSNNQGPGFGEFYLDDSGAGNTGNSLYHTEIGLGALALRPGSGEVIAGVMDPTGVNTNYSFVAFSGGVRHMNNSKGIVNSAYALYSSPTTNTRDGTFGKATGLGDIELLCDELKLIEIGNRVWLDQDGDGIQDACEPVLAGVNVSLYRSGTLVASTTTNANGEYYFNSLPTSSTVTGTFSTTNLLPNTAYQLVFGTSGQFTNSVLTLNNGKYGLTTANSNVTNANDLNDSDAQIATVASLTAPVISLTTGAYGENNHTLDVGFTCLQTVAGSISSTLAVCNIGTGTSQNNGRILVSDIQNANKAFISISSTLPSYTATSGQTVSSSAVSFTGLANPTSSTGTTYYITLYNGPNCYTVISTTLAQALCCDLVSVNATPSACTPATNQFSVSGTISLTNSPAQSLTVSSGSATQIVSVSAGQTSASYSLTGLTSGTGTGIVTVSASATTSCGASVSASYAAPSSCSIGLNLSANPGPCVSASNSYTLGGTITLTNAIAGTATITDGANSTTVAIAQGATSVSYSLSGLTSGTGSHTVVISYASKTASVTYTAPAACAVAVTVTVTPGICQTANNQYSVAGTLNLTNAIAGTATITDGANSTTVTVPAGATSVAYSLTGLASGTDSHTINVSYASKTASVTYTAPASCTVAIALTVTPGVCQSATNQYSISGTLSLTNAVAGTATITDGANSTTVAVTAGATSVAYSLSGLSSGTESHTVTASYASKTTSLTYSAPASCTVAIALTVTPGVCQSATNQYSISGTLSLTNAVAGTATITDGANSTTVAVTAGATSVAYSLSGLSSGTESHTVTASYASKTTSLTYSAPASCTVAIALTVTPGVCQSATNQYSISGTLSLTNAVAGTATITDGANSTTVAVTAGATSVAYSLSGLSSGTGSHTVTASYASKTTSLTYSAPASCTVAIALTVTPGVCQSAT